MKVIDTEQKILEAATEVFQTKGMYGARMQEIADKANINKAMLHYYYRSKQKLFEAVFKTAVSILAPKLRKIVEKDEPLFDKIRNFTHNYIDFISKHSYLPKFIILELNRNPELIQTTFRKEFGDAPEKLKFQLQSLVQIGVIRPIEPSQLLIDVISLSIFPFIGKPILQVALDKDDASYQKLIDERKNHVADFVINSIKIS